MQMQRSSGAACRIRSWLAFGFLALMVPGGCAPGSDLSPVTPYNGGIYRLGVGDQIRLITYGEDQLSKDFRLGDGGNIAMPLLGSVHAEGLTSAELGNKIAADLRAKNLFRDPSVSVEITAYRRISVIGEVAKPGEYAYEPGMTMLTAIAAAGGFTYRSVEDYAYVVRQVGNQPIVGKIRPQDYVAPGDVIKVYERYF